MALSTTQYGYIIDPMVPFTDGKGNTIKDGFVRVFVAGSSTPVVTYRNFDGATNQVLIELDNSGRTKTSVIGSKGLTYKVCVYDAFHSQESPILTVDKVSVIGANITAGAGATVVTGLDGLTTKPDGFVDASVIGTDGYVALDHTLVTDDLDTDAKVTAVENDRYVPLLNEDVNDPDSKMTLGRLWQWVLGKIKSLSTTITAFRTGDYIAVDGTSGTAKMSKDDLLKEAALNAGTEGYINKADFSAAKKYPLIGCDLISSNGNVIHPYKHTAGTRTNLTGFSLKSNSNYVEGGINDAGTVYSQYAYHIYYYQVKKGEVVSIYAYQDYHIVMGFNASIPALNDTIDTLIGKIVLAGAKREISFVVQDDGYFLFSCNQYENFKFKVTVGKLDDSIGIKVNREFLNIYDETSVTWNKYINSDGRIFDYTGYTRGVTDYILLHGQDLTFTPASNSSAIANAVVYDEHYNIVEVVPNGSSQLKWKPGYYCARITVLRVNHTFINYGLLDDFTTYLNDEKKPFLDSIENGLKKILRKTLDIEEYSDFHRDYENDKIVGSRVSESAFNLWVQFTNKITEWSGTKFVLEFDIDIKTASDGTFAALWISDGTSRWYSEGHQARLADIRESGHYVFEIDTAYYAVYYSWTEFNFWFLMKGITHDSAVTNTVEYSNVRAWCYTPEHQEFNNFGGDSLPEILHGIDSSIDSVISSQEKGDYIVAPDGTKFIQSIDNSGNIFGIPLYPNKAVFIGNSLLVGNGAFGMNASDNQHDYYHYITDFITSKNPSASYTKIYGSPLEHSTTIATARQNIQTIVDNIPADANFVLIQMGDNVNTAEKRSVFQTSCGELIAAIRTKAPRARLVWAGTWFNREPRDIIIPTCASLGVQWIPIASIHTTENESYIGAVVHLASSATRTLSNVTNVAEVSSGRIAVTFTVGENFYMSELDVSAWSITGTTLSYTSEYSITDSTGVASHPGDNGFRLIANKILFDTKMSESENTYPAEESENTYPAEE